MTTTETPLLTEDDRAAVAALLVDVDSVELKLTVPEGDQRSTVAALGLDPLQAEIRQVFFFDTPDLALNASGLVVRVRRTQKKGDDSVVKLRPVVPAELPKGLRRGRSCQATICRSCGVLLNRCPPSAVTVTMSSMRTQKRPGR